MNAWSVIHLACGSVSLVIGLVLTGLRKGDRRHRWLGWTYVVAMAIALCGILIGTRAHPHPFAGYAVLTILVLAAAVTASRLRKRFTSWRAMHGALMSMTLMGAIMAALGVFGGAALGAGSGPAFYRLFNGVIAVTTVAGLGLILTRPVIWGRKPDAAVRAGYACLVAASSGALIVAQWRMAYA
jgi:uncharacterized membrane protein